VNVQGLEAVTELQSTGCDGEVVEFCLPVLLFCGAFPLSLGFVVLAFNAAASVSLSPGC